MADSAPTPSSEHEPIVRVAVGAATVTLLGTAHLSRASALKVRELVAGGEYDAVAVELCPSRHRALRQPQDLAQMDLFQVLRQGKAPMVLASLALSAYQQRLAEQLGIEPGAEMRAAIESADAAQLPVLLIDRDIGVTLKRLYRGLPWTRRLTLLATLAASVVSRERISEAQIERLKEGDVLESALSQFAAGARDLYVPLIEERDRYMAARLHHTLRTAEHRRVLAVVGAGHVRGLSHYLEQDLPRPGETIALLERVPPASRWPKLIPWAIVGAVLAGFALGFTRNPHLGWSLVADWVVINGTLAASGALAAAAHPLTVLTAFAAAPLTSLNPMVGAGMVTAAVEVWLRKPSVGDFGRLRLDTAHWRGWWHNRVARTLLVFLLSTLGSAVGTYVAGLRIAERLMTG